MRLDQLNYIYQVSKYGSINETAKQLYISQSTISTAISALENELGVQIFNRSKHGVRLTEAGQAIVDNAAAIFEHVENINQLASEQTSCRESALRITAFKNYLCAKNLAIISQIKARHPNAAIYLEEKRVPRVLEDVQSGKVNFGIVTCEEQEKETFCKNLAANNLICRFLYHDRLGAFCSAKHPLAGQMVSYAEVRHYPIIGFANLCTLPSMAEHKRSYNVESTEVMKRLLLDNPTDVLFLYETAFENDFYFDSGQIRRITISDWSVPCLAWAVYLKGTVLSYLEKELLSYYEDK